MTYIRSMKNEECNHAIRRVFGKIDIHKINHFIDEISCMSTVRKTFYKKIMYDRYQIIETVYNKLNSN